MKKIINNYYIILIPIIILNIISLIYLKNTIYFKKQLLFIVSGHLILLLVSKINYKFIIKYSKIFYLLSILLLTLVLFIGKEINGSKAWLKIGLFSIQPSEICKISLIIILSIENIKNNNLISMLILTTIPSILTFIEPDTGAIIIYFLLFISQLKYIKNKSKILITISALVIIFISLNIYLYKNNPSYLSNMYGAKIFYRLDRIISFKNQDNIQNTNSLISIGSHHLVYIPENHNDFIFASIISKYNPLSLITILISYVTIIFYYIKKISTKKNISNIINFSILNMLLFQIFYNIFMNLSLLPIIGIPLPFLSYGGSYLTTIYLLIGLSINLNKHYPNKDDNKDNYTDNKDNYNIHMAYN